MTPEFRLITENSIWNRFVETSPQGTIFSTTDFLETYQLPVDYCVLCEGDDILIGLAVIKRNGQAIAAPIRFGVYQQTILYSPSVFGGPVHSSVKTALEITNTFLEELWKRYDSIGASIHHSISDLRALDWFNYGNEAAGNFQVRRMYTGRIDLNAYANFDEYLFAIRRTRRQEYNAGLKKGLTSAVETKNFESFWDLYEETFARQEIDIQGEHIEFVKKVVPKLVTSNHGILRYCFDSNKNCVAATFFVHDNHSIYYFLGANSQSSRSLNAGTFLFLETMKSELEGQKRSVDVVGINSPNRGDFKVSFNASPIIYYLANCKKPN